MFVANVSRILWEDSWCLVANKPSGMLTQGAPGIPTFESELREFIRERDGHAGQPYLALPHRLDRPVSGVMLAAKNVRATKRFGDQFATRKIEKRYLAVWSGVPEIPQGRWQDTMRKIPERPLSELVPPDHPDAQVAVLEYSVLAIVGSLSLVEIRLETGRMHQIRLQASSRGFPIVGDELYGSTLSLGPHQEDGRLRPIALHARRISFRHPQTAVAITVAAPVPDVWQELAVVGAVEPSVIM